MQVSRFSWEMIVAGLALTVATAIVLEKTSSSKESEEKPDDVEFADMDGDIVPPPPPMPRASSPRSNVQIIGGDERVVIKIDGVENPEELKALIETKRAKVLEKLKHLDDKSGVKVFVKDFDIRTAEGNVIVLGDFDSTSSLVIGETVAASLGSAFPSAASPASPRAPAAPRGPEHAMAMEKAREALAAASQAFSTTARTASSFQQSFSSFEPNFTASGTAIQNVSLYTDGGNIRVTLSDDESVYVQVKPTKPGVTQAQVDELFDITMKNNDKNVDIAVKRKSERNGMWESNFGIEILAKIPGGKKVTTTSGGGNIEVIDFDGKVNVDTHGGNIVFTDFSGDISAETRGGNVTFTDVRGRMDVLTRGGNIELIDVDADMKVHTNGGNVRLTDVQGNIAASTNGGNIRADLSEVAADCSLKTNAGNIDLTLPEDCSADLEVKGMTVSVPTSDGLFKGKVTKDWASGTWNSGGPKIIATTSVGRVSVRN